LHGKDLGVYGESAGPGDQTRKTAHLLHSGYSTEPDTSAAVSELFEQFGEGDGELAPGQMGNGGISAVVLPTSVANRAMAAIADFSGGVDAGLRQAARELEEKLGTPLRDLNPKRYVGLILIDGLHASEEQVNESLGNIAPLLSFVGGSAGDDLKNLETKVFSGTRHVTHGAVLLLLDLAVPFTILKSCSFKPAGHTFVATEVDLENRTVWKFNDRPAAEVYAQALGTTVDAMDFDTFALNPVGLMMDEEPFIRSVQVVRDGKGLKFHCQILEGMEVELMRPTDLVDQTEAAIKQAVDEVGGAASGALLFDCTYRKLTVESHDLKQPYVASLGDLPFAGFHTYGESWLGHMNCTITGIIFG
jgi:hypothetical protein